MNTYKNFELNNGTSIKLTFNLKSLLKLKTNYKEIYDAVNNVITRGAKDIFDMVILIYGAYLCALESEEMPVSYDTFLEIIPQNIDLIINTVDDLISPKKK